MVPGGQGVQDCIKEANEVVSHYNSKLAERVVELQKNLPGLQMTFCDTYRGIMEIISSPLTYGTLCFNPLRYLSAMFDFHLEADNDTILNNMVDCLTCLVHFILR